MKNEKGKLIQRNHPNRPWTPGWRGIVGKDKLKEMGF